MRIAVKEPLKIAILSTGIILLVMLFVSTAAARGTEPDFWDPVPDQELARNILSRMTDEEKLAQILMFGWAGLDPSPLVLDWVEERSLGNIKIFGWNTDDTFKVAKAITLLQGKAAKNRFGIPLFVATDQEGGWIRHVKGRTSQTPGNLAIGASGLPSDAWYSGYYISRELAALGINLNFAPTVDLYTDHASTVIGTRSFGEDPEGAGILGASFVAGSTAAGVLTTAKHYPGHGDTGMDSHGNMPVIRIDEKTLFERELVPFRRLVEAGVPAIMSGHLSFPEITGNRIPATFCPYFLDDLLRKQLGFDGLIITDDIMMNGATDYAGSVSRVVELAIEAGNNIVESSTTPSFSDPLWRNTLNRMKRDEQFRARVEDSVLRVLVTKLGYFKGTNPVGIYPEIADIAARVPDPDGASFFQSQAVRSVTVLRNGKEPRVDADSGSVLIASQFASFLDIGRQRFPDASIFGVNDRLGSIAGNYDTIIFCLSSDYSLSVLKKLHHLRDRLIVVSAMSPVLLGDVPWVESAIAVYSYSPWSFTAAFGAIAGDFVPTGTLPLKDIQ
ncbi:MAG TPA: glycoside hydrolase family 3 protein [Treponemataceae bacterium]|mgnify:FL=1|nr:glycoside hydrolase family 3 protein [Treponemataceae bacterium]HOS34212.1 glycoside hydrolase family 3 protein [Treponemataceae bacterium]HOU37869.1 glycoside hydrolase family 3 protein [Treponemataceae bacterium]HPL90686.1 glycoside hydrolase family 3 protein [Treponemataceae bacterium]HQF73821.1 glycoside hydrolase family 3 protein [Treponemataceae bacterium]